jgi:hypothetical protein
MSRRVSLPGADELFRATIPVDQRADQEQPAWTADRAEPAERGDPPGGNAALAAESGPVTEAGPPGGTPPGVRRTVRRRAGDRRPTGRERHEEKITVYVSAEELLELEQARLTLRADHGVGIDRGRIVREALAIVLADFDAKGEASTLVRRLRSL